MAFQHQVLDTIVAMKAALARRVDTSDSEDSNSDDHRPLNLKRKQRHARHGRQTDIDAPPAWKRKVAHAGYTRYVINRNAPRFDDDGDILPPLDDEEEEGADNRNLENEEQRNIYAGVDLEEIFAPLTTAASLPEHPALSLPYTSKHLSNLTQDAAELVQKEQDSLWIAKNIMLKLRGDMAWVPCGVMETPYDRIIKAEHINGAVGSASTNGTNGNSVEAAPTNQPIDDGTATPVSIENDTTVQEVTQTSNDGVTMRDTDMTDGAVSADKSQENGVASEKVILANGVHTNGNAPALATNGHTSDATALGLEGQSGDASAGPAISKAETNGEAQSEDETDNSSEPMAHRMTTRARAQEEATIPSNRSSPTTSNSVHPFFNFPLNILPDSDFGLPAAEAEDTRALLLMFVQKHEEIVRNAAELHQELLKADAMRKDVLKWCKADGHIGEMSDGEDWYDEEEWGLDGPLVKGRDEEEDATVDVGKKTRQRRGREDR